MKGEWFESWFDSPYYHQLYQHRDEKEAKMFINNLIEKIGLNKGGKVLDLACGKGRHSISLNDLGMDVLGVDLSKNSIEKAKEFENEKLRFQVHDMREVIQGEKFDAILNLFTSFGYFDNEEDSLKVLKSIHSMLKDDGVVVIDFLNAKKVIENLVSEEKVIREGICFYIRRWHNDNHVFKEIRFTDEGKEYCFIERVQLLKKENFEKLFKESRLEILDFFGDYNLMSFDEKKSDRLIIIGKKK